ncbi:hypothetical protein GQ44DRAFT_628523 [Phaeosphaeriaceae sp. PMI808]|nr:hypothetical protein GQ44DRAFT_628523 [Phaeosphaeriaceae sp. PMI808]
MLGLVPPSVPTAEPQTSLNTFLSQTPILSPTSSAYTESTADDPNRVSTPKPDIVVGLDHVSFSQLQGRILWDLQDSLQVLSEPHQSTINLHFPFLIVEAKGLVIGSNMVGAQNQVAVDGACALNILHDFQAAGTANMPSLEQPAQRQIIFSIATEGPIHELWVHYKVGEAYHMTLLRIWRTTVERDAKEFVQALCKVLGWGANGFRTAILEKLTAIETKLRERQREVA